MGRKKQEGRMRRRGERRSVRGRSRYGRREEVDQGNESEGREGGGQCKENRGNKRSGNDDGGDKGDREGRKGRKQQGMGHKILRHKRR